MTVVVVLALIPMAVSYQRRLAEPGNETASEKSVEWLRDNHLGSEVNWVENQWYTHHAPKVGGAPRPIKVPTARIASTGASRTGPASGTAPDPIATTTTAPPRPTHLAPPTDVRSPAAAPIAGEGHWTPIGPTLAATPGMYTTQLRPDSLHTSFLAVAVWMDPSIVRFRLHPGLEVPGGQWNAPSSVIDPVAGHLMAAFNSGFRMKDAQGGYYSEGRTSQPLLDGKATLVIDANGVADVAKWGRDRRLGPDVASARQNLDLIVDGSKPEPGLDSNAGNRWGKTVGNKVFVWRSGVGVTRNGALVYVGGPSFSVRTLAETLVRVGAVRAMQLDINYAWVSFNSYQVINGTVIGTPLLTEMKKPGSRYLSPDSRDFVAVSLRDAFNPRH